MAKREPINAPPKPEKKPRLPKPGLPKGPVPLPLKVIAGAVLLAAVFIAAAIVGGGDGDPGVESVAPKVGGDTTTSDDGSRAADASTTELGYPAFATKNTTRVGGGDPAANAAGVALAVFPSAEPSQRPAAVTLVNASDWAGGIAAAVLVAAPVRAPILLSGSDEMPEESVEALRAMDPQGSPATKGAAALAVGDAGTPAGLRTTRAAGKGAAATAAAVARLRERLVGSPPRHIVVAPLGAPGFAMPAAAWAARSGDPVLFAGRKSVPEATVAYLREHKKVPVFVLGPSSRIASEALRGLDKAGGRVARVSGEDPVANAIALARYESGTFGWNINDPGHGFVVARDDEPLDAAAAAPLSASGTWGPLLLTDDAGTLPPALRAYLLDVKPGYTDDPTRAFYNHVWVIGDQDAIGVGQQAEIDSLAELAKIGDEG